MGNVSKPIVQKIDEQVLRWFGHVERMSNERIVKQAYEIEYSGIAVNTLLAKVCSDMNKPNGQFYLPPNKEDVDKFIGNLPIRKEILQVCLCPDFFDLVKATIPDDSHLCKEFVPHASVYNPAVIIFTFGSKTPHYVAAATVSDAFTSVSRLPLHASIFTAELVALIKALQYANEHSEHSFVI
ncbi:unnamed protein product [Rotaria magnacalcarata]|uniref:UmuC domain-containing protein n=1 Tax=Rotaria magnacalcarata TaxID=392030 RepID=A0A819VRU6_9BILA|nr:unnamed protein product [Rotaria magnacalcarata]